jgi:aspartate racemase
MKIIGIIGGIGPESTVEYYQQIIAAYRARLQDGSYPRILINSIDMTRMLNLIGDNKRMETIAYLRDEVLRLTTAGADVGLLASNTPHLVFSEIRNGSPIPLISIVEAACQEAMRLGLKKVGLFGTHFTMQGNFYSEVFMIHNIIVVTPELSKQVYIHDVYMDELVHGIIKDETKTRLLEIAADLRKRHGIQALILGGTELPLILKDGDIQNLPFLDTTKIHVNAVIDYILG